MEKSLVKLGVTTTNKTNECKAQFDGSVQERRNSIANALESRALIQYKDAILPV